MAISDFMSIKVNGLDSARRRLVYFKNKFPHEVAAALKTEAELTMTESKKEVPVDTGALKDSGFVDEPKIQGDNISIRLGYGGVATKREANGEITVTYAIIVHEDLNAHHTVGKAKFLEDPLKKRQKNILNNINLRVKRALERRGLV